MSETVITRRKQPWQAPDWPRAMRRATAAAYCDVSVGAFEREILNGRLPAGFMLGGREHWHRPALDAALDRITGGTIEQEPEYLREWREKYSQPTGDMPDYRRELIERYVKPKPDRGQVENRAAGRAADDRRAYSVRTLAERWECSEALVRKLIHQGKLARIPNFSLMRITADEVDRYEACTE